MLLEGLGFSYLFLRGMELLRAGAEGRVGDASLVDALNYLIPFHMLVAGPIQSWEAFRLQPAVPAVPSFLGVVNGLERIVSGLFKKFVLGRSMEMALLTGFRAPWPYLLVEIQVYCLWVFLDFSAYSDIAVGIGRLLGIATPENFDHPFRARNIIEFWERWHISLSTFIRRNIYFPLQLALMRRSEGRYPLALASVALGVSFLLCGLWHGVNLRFLLWGGLHATALVVCNGYKHLLQARLGRKGVLAYLERPVPRLFATVLTFEFVACSLMFIAHPATAFLE